MNTLLYSDDINLLTYWETVLDKKYVVYDDIDKLKSSVNSVIIINYTAFDKDQKNIIKQLTNSGNLIFVLDRTPNIQKAQEVLSYGAKAYGNALMKTHFIISAIDTIIDGMIWLHPEFVSQLINLIPSKRENDISTILEKLSDREHEVALLLKDGDTYKDIAQVLNITPRTIKAHAQSIYSKLHVKDRLALALLLK